MLLLKKQKIFLYQWNRMNAWVCRFIILGPSDLQGPPAGSFLYPVRMGPAQHGLLHCSGKCWLWVHKNTEVGDIIQFSARWLNPAREIWLERTCLLVFISWTSEAFLFLSVIKPGDKKSCKILFSTRNINNASYVYHYYASLIFISYNCNGVLMIVPLATVFRR